MLPYICHYCLIEKQQYIIINEVNLLLSAKNTKSIKLNFRKSNIILTGVDFVNVSKYPVAITDDELSWHLAVNIRNNCQQKSVF